jgi:membrane-bound metal-dependent hydrolase YbcI (DUF457 family)
MNTVTHALIPVICVRLAARRPPWLGRWGLLLIGVAGALPDLLTPHLSLESRMASWSHGIPCWLLFSSILVAISLVKRGRFHPALALCLSAAYLLHMACDVISGGVNLLYPFGDWVVGDYWVDPSWWIPLDVVCILLCYLLFRIIPGLSGRKAAEPEEG